MEKVILVGIDGGTFDILEPWVQKGELPAIGKMMSEGSYGKLRSTIPSLSIPAIPSMFTGMNPGKIGVFGFLRADGSSVTYNDIRENYVWDILANVGVKSCVVDVTGTFPPIMKNGVMISGSAPSEDSQYTYPIELKSKVRGFYAEFDSLKKLESDPQRNMHEIIDHAVKSQRRKWETFRNLMKANIFDLGIFWIVLSDDIQHFYWGKKEVLLRFFKEIDRIFGEMLKTFEDWVFLVVSDHGFEERAEHYFRVNSWLAEKGYMKLKKKKYGRRLSSRMTNIVRRVWGSLPKAVKRSRMSNPRTWRRYLLMGIDRGQTVAYSDTPIGIWISAEVEERRELLREKLISELKNLRDSSGRLVMREVWRREDIFSGGYADRMPDIILVAAENYQIDVFPSENTFANIETSKKRRFRGDHINAREGILIAYGKIFKTGLRIRDTDILDIAPTILSIFGCDTPEDVDGKPIKDIFVEGKGFGESARAREKKSAVRSTEISPTEEDQLLRRLRALGYID